MDNLNCESLCEIGNPWWICELMHFSPNGQEIVCGYLKNDGLWPIHFSNYDVASPNSQLGVLTRNSDLAENNTSGWPWEFKSLSKKDL